MGAFHPLSPLKSHIIAPLCAALLLSGCSIPGIELPGYSDTKEEGAAKDSSEDSSKDESGEDTKKETKKTDESNEDSSKEDESSSDAVARRFYKEGIGQRQGFVLRQAQIAVLGVDQKQCFARWFWLWEYGHPGL